MKARVDKYLISINSELKKVIERVNNIEKKKE